MSKEELIGRLLTASADELVQIEAVFTKTVNAPVAPGDRRLLTITETARELNVSRMTIHRMLADGRLPFVETRAGRRRIPSAAITALVKGRA